MSQLPWTEQATALAVAGLFLLVAWFVGKRESKKRHDIDATIYDRRRNRP